MDPNNPAMLLSILSAVVGAAGVDPNIQVAFISVLATIVTTAGVIGVAIINNKRERQGAASAGVEAGHDEKDILGRMLALISENERKEAQIVELKKDLRHVRAENRVLRAKLPLGEPHTTSQHRPSGSPATKEHIHEQ